MKRFWLSAVAVGLTVVGVWACGSSSDDDSLCGEEGGYCTSESTCGNVLPFGCGNSSNVCCAPGASTPTPAPTSTSTTTEDSGSPSTTATTPDSGSTTTNEDAGTKSTVDSGTTTVEDSGTKDSGTKVEDAGPVDAAKG